MAKLTLQSILSQFSSITKLNDNFSAIVTAFENTLSRDGTSPNAMNADLDMNSNQILNLPAATGATEPTRLSQVQELIANAGFDWKGAWALSTSYVANELVENDGSAYICILSHTSTADDEPGVGVNEATYWDLIAEKGDTGPAGADGTNGTDGSDGVFSGAEATVTPAASDKIALLDVSDSENPKYALFSDFGGAGGGAWVLDNTYSPSGVASVDVSIPAGEQCLIILKLTPVSDNAVLYGRITDDSFSTVKSGASDYQWVTYRFAPGATAAQQDDTADSLITFCNTAGIGNASGEYIAATIYARGCNSANNYSVFESRVTRISSSGTATLEFASGQYNTTDAIDGIRFYFNTGNIASGSISVYSLVTS